MKNNIQLVWGIALLLAGIGVFYRIPQVMPKVAEIEHFASILVLIRICFYILGIMLIAGGGQKIYNYFNISKK